MKKIIVLIGIALLTFGNANAQSEPDKEKTFNFIATSFESACAMGWGIKGGEDVVELISKNETKFIIKVMTEFGRNTKNHKEYTFDLKQLEKISYVKGNIKVKVTFKKLIKTEWTDSSPEEYDIVRPVIGITMCNETDANRLTKALNHFMKLMNDENSFFDD